MAEKFAETLVGLLLKNKAVRSAVEKIVRDVLWNHLTIQSDWRGWVLKYDGTTIPDALHKPDAIKKRDDEYNKCKKKVQRDSRPHKLKDDYEAMQKCPYREDWHYCCRCEFQYVCTGSNHYDKNRVKKYIEENRGK